MERKKRVVPREVCAVSVSYTHLVLLIYLRQMRPPSGPALPFCKEPYRPRNQMYGFHELKGKAGPEGGRICRRYISLSLIHI